MTRPAAWVLLAALAGAPLEARSKARRPRATRVRPAATPKLAMVPEELLTRTPEESPAPVPEPAPALASPPDPTGEPPAPSPRFEAQGFLALGVLRGGLDQAAPAAGVLGEGSEATGFAEVNLAARLKGESLRLVADTTLYTSTSGPRELVLLNELYGEMNLGALALSVGRKRLGWGTGIAISPLDSLAPPKNPLAGQGPGVGSFLFPLVELWGDEVALSGFISPSYRTSSHALPSELDFARPVLGARGYLLLRGVDLNVLAHWDEGKRRAAAGLSASTVLGDWYELHAEVLGHTGEEDLPSIPSLPACGPGPLPASKRLGGSALLGARRDFSDQTFVSVEYLYNGPGLGPKGFSRFRDQLPCLRAALAAAPAPAVNPVSRPSAVPLVLLRHHYLLTVFERPHLGGGAWEDVGVGASGVLSLEDRSAVVQVRAHYALAGRVTAGASVALPLGPEGGEFVLGPSRWMGALDLRLSY